MAKESQGHYILYSMDELQEAIKPYQLETRAESIEFAIKLWGEKHEEYCGIIQEYKELILQKKKLKIKLDGIKKAEFREFPEIQLLRCKTEAEARSHLLEVTDSGIRRIIGEIILLDAKENFYSRLKRTMSNYRWQIRNHDKPKTYCYALPTRSQIARAKTYGSYGDEL